MKIDIVTLFPSMFEGPFATSMLKKAQDKKLVQINYVDLRQFGLGPHAQVDDTPYGGGDGMVLKPEPIYQAVESLKTKVSKVVLMTPQGKTYDQPLAQKLANTKHMILVCGHYEGFDERIRKLADYQVSIGDYILTGGEIPAMVLTDSIVRLLPGVLGGANSAAEESFSDGKTLEYPQYTRPEDFRGMKVPKVLLSGDHGKIKAWRQAQADKRTKRKR